MFDEANSGDLIIVHCAVVKGDTPISLKWLFEGRHLEVGDGVGITALGDRVSALTIPAVRGEHAGEYACVADNPAGSARHSAHLKVNGTENTSTRSQKHPAKEIKRKRFLRKNLYIHIYCIHIYIYIYIYIYFFFETLSDTARHDVMVFNGRTRSESTIVL